MTHASVLLTTVLVLACLTSCERQQVQQAAAPASASPAAAATAQPTSVKPAVSLDDAVGFVEGRFSTQRVQGGTWSASEVKLRATPWSWQETEITQEGKEDLDRIFSTYIVHEYYQVDPQQLAYPVRQAGRSMTFECASGRCIKVKKFASKPAMKTEPIELDEERGKNTWHFSSEDEATRVSNAMNHALQLLGAKRSNF